MYALERDLTRVSPMADKGVGARIRARRMELGMSVKALAERAGVDRGRLTAIEDGANARSSTIGAIEAELNRLEAEINEDPDYQPAGRPGGLVTFRIRGNFGVDATVQGPVGDIDRLEASAQRLLKQAMEQAPGSSE